jgi:ubiquinone biosynthesis protein
VVSLVSTVRDIERLRQILVVLGRHGFGEIVERTGLGKLAPSSGAGKIERAGLGHRLRTVLQDLGPSFVKLGQIMSTRPDLIPADIIAELKQLQDKVPPVDFDELQSTVEAELGAPIAELFESFDREPLACASIAQVHRARLTRPGGGIDEVVVKIQRPGIKDTVARDVELLHLLARAIERSIPEARIYSPVGMVTEFDRAISAELDFTREAEHAERFLRAFEGDPFARFPRIHRGLSGRSVVTMEFLDGKKLQPALDAGYSGEKLAKNTLRILFKQIFEEGFFHADPHPGNLLILGTPDEPVLGMIDLGLVGRLSPQLRDKTVNLMLAAVRQDSRALADALYAIGTPTKKIDRAKYDAEVGFLAEKYLGRRLEEIEISLLLRDIVQGAVKYGLEIPPEFLMLGRTLMTIEGVGKEIYPQLDVFSELRPYVVKVMKDRYSPERISNDALRLLSRLGESATGYPQKFDEILDDLRRGTLIIGTKDAELPKASDLLGRRIFSGLTIAALIGGGSLLVQSGASETGYGMLGLAGAYLVAHMLRMWRAARRR